MKNKADLSDVDISLDDSMISTEKKKENMIVDAIDDKFVDLDDIIVIDCNQEDKEDLAETIKVELEKMKKERDDLLAAKVLLLFHPID